MLALNDILSRGGAARCRVSRQSDGCRQAGSLEDKTGSSFEVHYKRLHILDLSPETFVNAFPFPGHYVAYCKSNLFSSIQLSRGRCGDDTRRAAYLAIAKRSSPDRRECAAIADSGVLNRLGQEDRGRKGFFAGGIKHAPCPWPRPQ